MTDNVTNFLASGIEIKGTIRFQNDMHIDGKIEGEIISDKGKVTIGETAQIKGDITAGDVRIYGNVEGKVTSDRCELKQQARVVGGHEDPQPRHGRRRPPAGPHGNRLKPRTSFFHQAVPSCARERLFYARWQGSPAEKEEYSA